MHDTAASPPAGWSSPAGDSLLQSVPAPVLILHDDCSLSCANPAFFALAGHSSSDCIQLDLQQIIVDETFLAALQTNAGRCHEGKPASFESWIRFATGPKKFVAVLLSAIHDTQETAQRFMCVFHDLTAQKTAELELEQRLERLETVVDNLPVLLGAYDEKNRLLFWNKACEEATGYRNEDILHSNDLFELLFHDPEYREFVLETQRRNKNAFKELELDITCKNGERRTISWSSVSIQYPVPGYGTWAMGIDVTQRKQIEHSLQQSEERYRSLVEGQPDLIFISDADGVIRDYHAGAPDLLVVPPEQFLHRSYPEFLPHEIAAQVMRDTARVLRGERVAPLEYSLEIQGETHHFERRIVRFGQDKVMNLVRDITDRVRMQRELVQSETRYRTLVESSGQGIIVVQQKTIVFANPMAQGIIGWDLETLLARPFLHFIYPLDKSLVAHHHESRMAGNPAPDLYSFRIVTASGELRWMELSATTTEWSGKRAIMAFFTDITQRVDAERALKESRDRFRAIFENVPDALFMHEVMPDGQPGPFLDFNEVACQRTGYTREELRMLSPADLDAPDVLQRILPAAMAELQQHGKALFESEQTSKSGERIPVENYTSLVRIDGKELLFTASRDISDRKRAQAALQSSLERFRAIFDNEHIGLGISRRATGEFLQVNRGFSHALGFTPSEMIGRTSLELGLFTARQRGEMLSSLQAGSGTYGKELPFQTRSGAVRHFFVSICPLDLEEEACLLTVTLDITSRKLAQQQLQQSEERFRSIVNALPQLVCQLDSNLVIRFVNRPFSDVLQQPKQGHLDRHLNAVLGPVATAAMLPDIERALLGEVVHHRGKLIGADGQTRQTDGYFIPERTPTGEVRGCFMVLNDITHLVQTSMELESKARELEEMNTTLRVLLKERERDRLELHDQMLANMRKLITPYLKSLQAEVRNPRHREYLDIIERNIEDITSPFSKTLTAKYQLLTPNEVRVADMIRAGLQTKDIAGLLNVSERTVEYYRYNIRNKMGLRGEKANLATFLASLT